MRLIHLGISASIIVATSICVAHEGHVHEEVKPVKPVAIPYVWSPFAGLPPQSGAIDGPSASSRFNEPDGIAADAEGNLYVSDSLNRSIRRISRVGVVSTITGSTHAGATGGAPAAAGFGRPSGIVFAQGVLFVSDREHHAIRRVTLTGAVTTFAGLSGESGSADGIGSSARFNAPSHLAADAIGNLYVADTLNHVIRKITPEGAVTTLAGAPGTSGAEDGLGIAARFNAPQGIAVDASGVVYVSDHNNNTIRKITPDGVVTTLAGRAGMPGLSDGTGSVARFRSPGGLALVAEGRVIVADAGNHAIRIISPTGGVTTYAGRPSVAGYADGMRSAARFFLPLGAAVSSDGAIFVTDSLNHSVRKISPLLDEVATFAGGGGNFGRTDGRGQTATTAARFNYPSGVAVHSSGDVYVADSRGNTLRRVFPDGTVVRIAGGAGNDYVDGPNSVASVNYPLGIVVAEDRTVYFCEQQMHTVRKIAPDGTVSTVAGGRGAAGSADGTALAARFNVPSGIALDAEGNLFVSDYSNNTIRKIVAGTGVVTTFAGRAGFPGNVDGLGQNARFSGPRGLCIDDTGSIYVADSGNNVVRKISRTGVVSTLAATAGVGPEAVAVDLSGRIFIARTSDRTILRLSGNTLASIGGLSTSAGYAAGVGSDALFFAPTGVAVDRSGAVFISDAGNNIVVKGVPQPTSHEAESARISNFSIRANVGNDGRPLIVGVTIGGATETAAAPVLVRGVGPSLARFGVPGVLVDPTITLYRNNSVLATNDNWDGDVNIAGVAAQVGAFAFSNQTSLDAAIYSPLPTGSYTMQVSGRGGSGVALAEIYDAGRDAEGSSRAAFVNLSARSAVGSGANVLIGGFTISGLGNRRILIRAIGPSLTQFGVAGVLANPRLELFAGAMKVDESDNWSGATASDAALAVGAFPLAVDSSDAALVAILPPGAYSAQVSAVGVAGGAALLEIYDVSAAP